MFLLELLRFVRDAFALYLYVLCIAKNPAYASAYAKQKFNASAEQLWY